MYPGQMKYYGPLEIKLPLVIDLGDIACDSLSPKKKKKKCGASYIF